MTVSPALESLRITQHIMDSHMELYRAPSLDPIPTTMISQQRRASSIPGNFLLNEVVLKGSEHLES